MLPPVLVHWVRVLDEMDEQIRGVLAQRVGVPKVRMPSSPEQHGIAVVQIDLRALVRLRLRLPCPLLALLKAVMPEVDRHRPKL